MRLSSFATLVAVCALTGCGAPKGEPVGKILKNAEAHYGRIVTIRTKFRSGARCGLGTDDGQWKTYCKDCQFCKGPLVADLGTTTSTHAHDWPMILGGTWEYQDIRCKGPLNEVKCHPFELGKEYVVRGRLERHKPPKLLVSKFWPVEKK